MLDFQGAVPRHETSMRHRANLDILRAFAVCTVLVDHMMPTLHRYAGMDNQPLLNFTTQIGHAGVLAFFVHTSLVLMYSLERMHQTMDKVTVRFYVRRFFRIYPLAIFCILLVIVLHIPSNTWRDATAVTPAVVVANVLLIQNLVVKREVLGPLWSLPYEVQMYLVLPALFLLARKRRAPMYLGALIALFCMLGTALAIETGHLNMAAYVPCFLAGVLCYALRNRIRPRAPSLLWPPFVLTAIAIFCLANERSEATYWSGWIFSLVLGLAINAFRDSRLPRLNWAAEKVALYSYGMYLLHVPVLYLVFVKMHVQNLVLGPALFFFLTVAASMVTFHYLESPFIELGRRLSSSGVPEAPPDPAVVSAAP
jgi:peptidoglycan/LPS O-acetylase OafA/YrhL